MGTKQEILLALQDLPEDATLEDAMEQLYLLYKIERGVAQADAGLKVSQDEAKERMQQWLK